MMDGLAIVYTCNTLYNVHVYTQDKKLSFFFKMPDNTYTVMNVKIGETCFFLVSGSVRVTVQRVFLKMLTHCAA